MPHVAAQQPLNGDNITEDAVQFVLCLMTVPVGFLAPVTPVSLVDEVSISACGRQAQCTASRQPEEVEHG